jgi:hypothetical protein
MVARYLRQMSEKGQTRRFRDADCESDHAALAGPPQEARARPGKLIERHALAAAAKTASCELGFRTQIVPWLGGDGAQRWRFPCVVSADEPLIR